MKITNPPLRSAERIRKFNGLRLLVVAFFVASPLLAQDQQNTAQGGDATRAAKSMAKTMDPNSWMQMISMSMDPRIWANPISSCVACHDNEDVGRYQQMFGPFVAGMTNPGIWASPEAYAKMIASVTDPKAAEHWQRAVEEKYGLEPGAPLPTNLHSWWPGGMAPTMPPVQ